LIAETVLLSTVRTLPGDGIAGHAPDVFIHTTLTYAKTTTTLPAKTEFLVATVAQLTGSSASFAAVGRFCSLVRGQVILFHIAQI
jgi:hypothetical protein